MAAFRLELVLTSIMPELTHCFRKTWRFKTCKLMIKMQRNGEANYDTTINAGFRECGGWFSRQTMSTITQTTQRSSIVGCERAVWPYDRWERFRCWWKRKTNQVSFNKKVDFFCKKSYQVVRRQVAFKTNDFFIASKQQANWQTFVELELSGFRIGQQHYLLSDVYPVCIP